MRRMISIEEALEEVLAEAPSFGLQEVPLREAFGRVLGEDVCAPIDTPPFE